MTGGDGTERDGGTDGTEERPGTAGTIARLAAGGLAVALGLVWVGRLAVAGPTLGGGLLFELLAPLVLLYFGLDYLRTQRRALDRGS